MAVNTVIVTADKVKRRKVIMKKVKIALLILILILLFIFIVLGIIYNGGKFTITLDPNFSLKSGIVMYDNSLDKVSKGKLYASELDFLDNISGEWIPKDIDKGKEGSHNGKNYIAYTFFIENQGEETIDYWYHVEIDDVIKGVDDAIRISIYRNGEKTTYAKLNADTKKEEKDTKAFYSSKYPVLEERKDFKPNDIDRFTIVIYLEGDDPDCIDSIIGGEIKMHMEITEEHIDNKE